jgi:hypothetical protein
MPEIVQLPKEWAIASHPRYAFAGEAFALPDREAHAKAVEAAREGADMTLLPVGSQVTLKPGVHNGRPGWAGVLTVADFCPLLGETEEVIRHYRKQADFVTLSNGTDERAWVERAMVEAVA